MYVGQWPTFLGPVVLSSSRLFDGWMLYWRYWFSVTQTLTLNYIWRSVTYVSWSIDFALYLNYLMDKCHNWNNGSVWCKDLPHKMYVDQFLTFHGPVILSYLEDILMEECYTEDIVWYGPLTCVQRFWIIYPFLLIVVVDMKVFVNLARLEICVVYSRHEAGASVYFGHISSLVGNFFLQRHIWDHKTNNLPPQMKIFKTVIPSLMHVCMISFKTALP